MDVTMQHAKTVGDPINIHKAVKQDMILGADTTAILRWKREWFIYGPWHLLQKVCRHLYALVSPLLAVSHFADNGLSSHASGMYAPKGQFTSLLKERHSNELRKVHTPSHITSYPFGFCSGPAMPTCL